MRGHGAQEPTSHRIDVVDLRHRPTTPPCRCCFRFDERPTTNLQSSRRPSSNCRTRSESCRTCAVKPTNMLNSIGCHVPTFGSIPPAARRERTASQSWSSASWSYVERARRNGRRPCNSDSTRVLHGGTLRPMGARIHQTNRLFFLTRDLKVKVPTSVRCSLQNRMVSQRGCPTHWSQCPSPRDLELQP